MLARVIATAALACGSGTCFGQTANAWYPIDCATPYHVKNTWYDLRTFGPVSRIGMQFIEGGPVFLYNFSPTDAVQLQKASAIYASLLTAMTTGAPTCLLATATDANSPNAWDFLSIQVGPN